jgi:hypothetical protein
MISAPISSFFSLVSRRIRRSRMGITKANVFPEPVTASTTTSLCFIKRGIVEAWTGVICVWPIDCITSKLCGHISPDREGEKANTHIHDVKGVGREVQRPAKAVEADIVGNSLLQCLMCRLCQVNFGSVCPNVTTHRAGGPGAANRG